MGVMQGISVVTFIIDVFSHDNDIVFVVMVVGVCFSVVLVRRKIITNVVTTTTLKQNQQMFCGHGLSYLFRNGLAQKGKLHLVSCLATLSKIDIVFPWSAFGS